MRLMAVDTDECVFFDWIQPYGTVKDDEGVPRSLPGLVCRIAHGTPPTPDHEGAHRCGNGHLNCVNGRHVRWATEKENGQDKVQHGRSMPGQRHPLAKLTNDNVAMIKALLAKGVRQHVLADQFGASRTTICHIANGRQWRSVQPLVAA